MHICNCENPRLIINPQTGEKVRVRCGKCNQCKNAKSKNWVNRLTAEADNNAFAFMVNLTYDDLHLPRLVRGSEGLVFANRDLPLCIPYDEIDNLFSDLPEEQKAKEYQYLNDRLSHRLGLPCICIDDLQKFNKRLNKYIHDHFTSKYANFRFFLCGEYGPATYRIHYHGIYYLNDREVAFHFPEIVSACWQNGDSPVAHIYSKGGFSYVAQYVNMLTHLPKVYEISALRPRYTFSKLPAIGSPKLLASEIREVHDRKPVKRTVWDPQASRYSDVPVNSAFKSRFFPKCSGYSSRPFAERAALYRFAEFFPSERFSDFCEKVYQFFSLVRLHKLQTPSYLSGIVNYVRELHMDTKERDKVEMKLYRDFLVSKRYIYLRSSLRCSDEWLLKSIDEFYKKYDYERLKDFYLFQQDYSKLHSTLDLINMYPEFSDYLDNVTTDSIQDVPDYLRFALFSFGIDWYFGELPSLDGTYDAKLVKSQHDKIYKDTHKAHDINNYRYSKRFHDSDPLLQNLILKYAT